MSTLSKPSHAYRKHFIPLESNPEVFTELIHQLGVSTTLEFQDVLSLDDPELLAFLPRPAYALILVFPTTPAYKDKVRDEDAKREPYETTHSDSDVSFFKQTINNACGLYAILHAICNGEARNMRASTSIIARLQSEALSLNPHNLALQLEGDAELEEAYARVARKGDTEAPENADDEVDYHYVCFVRSHNNDHLYQLDGDREQPIDFGLMPANEDVLSKQCLDVVRGMIGLEDGNLNFSLMALVPTET
ncbi:ubiquitin carboxyl-terminal hydrolase, family 1 [Setomelanomma holmii]|uniref:Ubiquitin carboxyl-terminal hydrolase n=1 Tax=Setomelanomma holmii TaxID=210430 RepID=A0A9P4LQ41_9PLEO|nr:ubiquitin carboxyl-terminal hydrolase, family 1 [Setomelanomma holmii]